MGTLIRMLAVARRQWGWMLIGIVLGIVVMIANMMLMAVSGWFIASMAVAGASGVVFNYFAPAAAIRMFALVRTVGRYLERLASHEAGFRVLAQLRVWLFNQVAPLAPAGLERYTTGDVAGRLRTDIDALESLYLRIILPLATGGVGVLLAAAYMAWWSRPAAVVLLIALSGAGLLLPLLAQSLAKHPGRRAAALAGELRTTVTEGLQGSEELILLGAVELQAAQVDAVAEQLVAEQERLSRINALTMAGSIACSGIGVAAVLFWAGRSVASGELAGPLLVMLILFAAASFEAVAGVPGALQLMPTAQESVRRIRELADAPLPVLEPVQPVPLPTDLTIELREVTVAYDTAAPVLTRFSMVVPAGQRVALTGPSGCGKSSLVAILLRFRPYQGSITIGGVNLSDLAADDIQSMIAAVPQQPHLLNTTIRENLLLANPHATEHELQQALADALLTDWVAGLPLGLDTRVGESGNAVSGGEARRIALARALLKNAPIMILDEPTEGLDLVTERAVVARLAERLTGKTVLVVSHRPACLKLADTIVQLE